MPKQSISDNKPSILSILVFLILFFPLGFYLIYKRNKIEEQRERSYYRETVGSSRATRYNRNADMTMRRGLSWGWIIFLLIIFFPVGIPLLIKKVNSEKFYYDSNGRSLLVLGRVLIGIGVFYMLIGLGGNLSSQYEIPDPGTFLIGCLLFVMFGMISIYYGSKLLRRSENLKRYMALVDPSGDTSIVSIAALFPTSFENACKDLQFMIDEGFFQNAFLDLQKKQIRRHESKENNVEMQSEDLTTENAQKQNTIRCSNCGAISKNKKDRYAECDYCGSPL